MYVIPLGVELSGQCAIENTHVTAPETLAHPICCYRLLSGRVMRKAQTLGRDAAEASRADIDVAHATGSP